MFLPAWLIAVLVVVVIVIILTIAIWRDADGGGYFGSAFEALATIVLWGVGILVIVAILVGKFLL